MKRFFLFLFFISSIFAQQKFPVLSNYANDFTGTLNQQQLYVLDNQLRIFDDSTSNQLVVLMIPTLNGEPIDDYSIRTAMQNKIGSKKNDNGVLILVVKNDKEARIEVGYGLEGALPDALASSIVRNVMIPHFKVNDYFGGLQAGVNAVIAATKGEYKVAKHRNTADREKGSGIITLLMIIFFIITFFFRGRGRGLGALIFWGGLGGLGGFGGGGSSGGGFGGGGFGGFSGGGGSFGGGGASGGW